MGGVRCLGLFPKKKNDFFLDAFPYYFPFITCGLKQRFKKTTQAALTRTPPSVTLRMFSESSLHHTALPLLEKTLSCFPEFQMRLRQSSSVETLETN